MKRAAQLAIRGYRRWISPALPPSCRFVPTCSEYAHDAIGQHGLLLGGLLAVWRLLRCQPLSRAGFDPVPDTLFHQHSQSCKR
jgi:putative membrane protein insertion efficiency factor